MEQHYSPFDEGSGCGKWVLFAVAFGAGVIVAGIAQQRFGLGLPGTAALSVLLALAYSVIGAVCSRLCLRLRLIAFPRESFSTEALLLYGVLWPLALPFWLIITPFFVGMRRIFEPRDR